MFPDVALARRIERAEAGMSFAMACVLRDHRGIQSCVEAVGEGYAIYAGPGSPFNKIIGAGLESGGLDEAALDRAERVFEQRGEPSRAEVCVLAHPDVFARLDRRGYRFTTVEHVLGLSLPVGSPPAASLDRVRVTEADTAPGEWIDVVVAAFAVPDVTASGVTGDTFPAEVLRATFEQYDEVPGFHRYLAHVEGHVAGGGGLYVADRVGILCGAATLSRFRRQGVQTALLRQRLEAARSAGCDLVVVTTAPGTKSQQNVQRQGFELLYARAVMVRGVS